MIRKLLATTALTAVLAGGAMAQATTDGQGQTIFTPEYDAEFTAPESGYFEADTSQLLATSLLGQTIYSGSTEEAEAVGDVNDIVMSPDGMARAVVVGVGGFLGIGQKEVAIDFSRVSWSDQDGQRRLVVSATAEELEAAPEFDRGVISGEQDAGAGTGAMTTDQDVTGQDTMNQPAQDTTDQDVTGQDMTDQPAQSTTDQSGQSATDQGTMDQDQGIVSDDATTQGTAEGTANGTAEGTAQDDAGAGTTAMPGGTAVDNGVSAGAGTMRENMTPVEQGAISADELIGARVYGSDDADIGEIGDVILSADDQIEAYIVDVGGFLGIGEKPVALSSQDLEIYRDQNNALSVFTPFTEDQLANQPEYSEDAYNQDPNALLAR